MKYWYQKPDPALSAYVRSVLILEGFGQSDKVKLPIVTNGMQSLFCKTEKGSEGSESVIHLSMFGRSIPSEYLEVYENTTIIAYFFFPFTLASIFDIPARTILAGPVDLHEWNTHKTNALKTQLSYATLTSTKVDALNNLLIHLLTLNKKGCEIVLNATDHIMSDHGTGALSDVLKKLNINERTFQRIFKKYVGITPNQYRRICQFDVSFSQLRANKFNSLSDVAYDSGFADQSHFIRSFKEFTATTPQQYLLSGLKDKKR